MAKENAHIITHTDTELYNQILPCDIQDIKNVCREGSTPKY